MLFSVIYPLGMLRKNILLEKLVNFFSGVPYSFLHYKGRSGDLKRNSKPEKNKAPQDSHRLCHKESLTGLKP